jgi:ABC-type proline/glycine betaine transport systems, ATPase components
MAETAIRFEDVTKKFNKASYYAADHLSFTIEEGEFITILGSSGCGKTTLLKMVNRLYEPDSGKIILFGEDISTVDAVTVRRRIGYVIQETGLFPHMTIEENVGAVPKLMKWDKAKIAARVDELLETVGLPPAEFKKRYPSQLSGGQQQRVGLARALAISPKIMLMDEPFGAVDAITRTSLQDELLRLHEDLRKTFLFVTHDVNEAFKLGSRVMIMDKGRICQFDTPQNIIKAPADGFVRSLITSAAAQERIWEGVKWENF